MQKCAKKIRIEKNLTQKEVADLLGISLRSYKSYENDDSKRDSLKYRYLLEKLNEINQIDEEHGIRKKKDIEEICSMIFENKKVDVLNVSQLKDNIELTKEILKDGIKIYG